MVWTMIWMKKRINIVVLLDKHTLKIQNWNRIQLESEIIVRILKGDKKCQEKQFLYKRPGTQPTY